MQKESAWGGGGSWISSPEIACRSEILACRLDTYRDRKQEGSRLAALCYCCVGRHHHLELPTARRLQNEPLLGTIGCWGQPTASSTPTSTINNDFAGKDNRNSRRQTCPQYTIVRPPRATIKDTQAPLDRSTAETNTTCSDARQAAPHPLFVCPLFWCLPFALRRLAHRRCRRLRLPRIQPRLLSDEASAHHRKVALEEQALGSHHRQVSRGEFATVVHRADGELLDVLGANKPSRGGKSNVEGGGLSNVIDGAWSLVVV